MPLGIDGILFDVLSTDPGSLSEGQVWYNSTSQQFKVYRNSTTTNLVDQVAFTGHTSSTSNPHATTLEQARAAGSTLSGAINMGGFAITNVAIGVNPTDGAQRQWVTDQITARVRGMDWQDSVLNFQSAPPASPSTGDRYVVLPTGTGVWASHDNNIAIYNGSGWDFIIPNEGFTTRDETANVIKTFDGTSWGAIGGATSHSSLLNLAADDHVQYLLVNGTRAMTAALNMGTFAITNVGTVDGVTVSAHASRHLPGGVDALATAAAGAISVGDAAAIGVATSFARSDHKHSLTAPAAPANVTKSAASAGVSANVAREDHKHDISTAVPVAVNTSNTEGTATTLARSDHTHDHGSQTTATHHALTSTSGHGFFPKSNLAAVAAPTVSNDGTQGYVVGSLWIYAAGVLNVWIATSVATGAAVWEPLDVNLATVVSPNVDATASAVGTSLTASRQDHTHQVNTGTPVAIGTINGAGSAASLVRSDHVHAHGNQTLGSLHALTSTSGHGFFPASNLSAITNPAVSNDTSQGYAIGSMWINTTTNAIWIATSVSTGAAIWVQSTTTPLATIASPSVGNSAAVVGVATSAARQDHTHLVTSGTPVALTVGGSNAAGSAITMALSDHVHSLPAFGTAAGTFTQGNDSRLSDDRTASGLRTASGIVTVGTATAPTAGQVLTATSGTAANWQSTTALSATTPSNVDATTGAVGTGTTSARSDHTHQVNVGTPVALGTVTSAGTAVTLARSDHVHAHGTQTLGTLHSVTSISGAGFFPPSNLGASTNPTVTNDGTQGYAVGSLWLNTTSNTVWIATSVATGAAVWDSLVTTPLASTASPNVDATAAVVGVATSAARQDHTHLVNTGTPIAIGTANGAGTATTMVRSDHVHAHGNQTVASLHALTSPSGHGFFPASNLSAITNPTTSSDNTQGYAVGSMWVNITGNTIWVATSVATGAAVWDPIVTPLASVASPSVGNTAAVVGTGTTAARQDHTHLVTSGTPVAIGTANSAGSATTLALSDHVHAHGNQTVATLHALTSPSGHGFFPATNLAASANPTAANDNTQGYTIGSMWLNTANNTVWQAVNVTTGAAVWVQLTNISGAYLAHKAGKIVSATFAGNPKKATVTFATAFADANYSVTLSCVTGGSQFAPSVESQLASSFVINLGTASVGTLVQVNWTCVKHGESA